MGLKIIVTSVFILTLVGCGAQQSIPKLSSNELQASNEIDFELLKEWVKDKKIVSLGESTHGLGTFFSMKSEVIQFLHKELGYEVLAMEGGFADINLAWQDVDQLSALELRNKTLYGNFICQELEPLYKYIKANASGESPLLYTGFDTQVSGDYYETYLDAICTHLKLDIDVKEAFSANRNIYQASFEADSTNFIKYRDPYLNVIDRIKREITENKKYLQETSRFSDLELSIILRHLDFQYKEAAYNYSERMNAENMHQAIVRRDQFMAQNIEWIIETLYPNKKIIIWAHNGHVGKSGINHHATKMMGEHLKDIYQDDYFSIGFFAYKGKTYQHWTGESIAFENSDSTAIEYQMKRDLYQYTYQKFGNRDIKHWTNQEATGFEIENGGKVTFIPSERFDAAINVYSGDVPTFGEGK